MNLAVVRVNGRDAGTLWTPPFRTDITRLLHKGQNTLEIEVSNLWVNRLIGDEREPDDCTLSKKMLGFFQRKCADGVVRDIPLGRAVIAFPEEVLGNRPRRVARYAFSSWRYLLSDGDLRPAGLLGPVKLEVRTLGL